jgi:hypothetical protein
VTKTFFEKMRKKEFKSKYSRRAVSYADNKKSRGHCPTQTLRGGVNTGMSRRGNSELGRRSTAGSASQKSFKDDFAYLCNFLAFFFKNRHFWHHTSRFTSDYTDWDFSVLFPQLWGKCQGKTCVDGARPALFLIFVLFCVLFVLCICVLYCTVLYCTVLYCTVLYCTLLYSTVL